MKVTIDAKTGQVSLYPPEGGVVGFFSWRRLSEILYSAGEVRPTEILVSFSVDERGIEYRVERK